MTKIEAWPHQKEAVPECLKIFKEHFILYVNWEERTGKTLTAIMLCEETKACKVLIVTKINAMDGWNKIINGYNHINSYTVINYHSVHKVKGDFDIVILDEPHNYISGYPKPSKIWASVFKFTKNKPIIYMSATSHAQGTQLLYHQFKLSSFSPWKKFKDFYEWFKHYAKRDSRGNLKMLYIGANRQAIDYTAVDHDKAFSDVKHLFSTKTRSELGFEQEPEDVLHYIELSEKTKYVYNVLLKDNVLTFTYLDHDRDYTIVCDTPIKLRWTLHMLEGGGFKIAKGSALEDGVAKEDIYLPLRNSEKIDYILNTWGDTEDLVIMFQYKVEAIKLGKYFKKAKLLQAQTNAEGVDLSMYKHLVIYSQNFSTAQHTQRRARQANKNRDEEIKVHYLLVKKAVSEQVYKTVSVNKTNFVDKTFHKEEI